MITLPLTAHLILAQDMEKSFLNHLARSSDTTVYHNTENLTFIFYGVHALLPAVTAVSLPHRVIGRIKLPYIVEGVRIGTRVVK